MRKKKILVTSCDWAGEASATTQIEFAVYKTSLFGGLKQLMSYEGWCVMCAHQDNGEIDTNSIQIQDGNFGPQPFNTDLVVGVLRAAEMKLNESGETPKAQILNKAYMKLIQASFR